jgi:DNA-binding response OmpR family regulator
MQTRKLILEAAGHTVVTVQSDSEIVAACREFEFDVVVIGQSTRADLKRDWFRTIREHCPLAKILEVYVTSDGIALPNADAWLESPVVPDELAESVAALARLRVEQTEFRPLRRCQDLASSRLQQ